SRDTEHVHAPSFSPLREGAPLAAFGPEFAVMAQAARPRFDRGGFSGGDSAQDSRDATDGLADLAVERLEVGERDFDRANSSGRDVHEVRLDLRDVLARFL